MDFREFRDGAVDGGVNDASRLLRGDSMRVWIRIVYRFFVRGGSDWSWAHRLQTFRRLHPLFRALYMPYK